MRARFASSRRAGRSFDRGVLHMTATDCPSREKLREYSVGMLSKAQSDELAAHLDSCPGCQATILTLEDAADTLVGRLRTPPTAEPYSAEPAFQAALAQVLQGGTGILPVLGRDTGKMPVPPSEDNSVTSLPRAWANTKSWKNSATAAWVGSTRHGTRNSIGWSPSKF